MNDARFADADPAPLALVAQDVEDLTVISALVQDAVLPVTEITYDMRHRQLALLLNRFRWEDAESARREERPGHAEDQGHRVDEQQPGEQTPLSHGGAAPTGRRRRRARAR